MNGVRIDVVAGGIVVSRRMFEGVDRFVKNGSCVLYFDVEGIVDGGRNHRSFVFGESCVDGRRSNKVGDDDGFDRENFDKYGGNFDIYSDSVGIEFVGRRLFDDGRMTELM